MRWVTSGESHGYGIVAVLEGFPAGLSINEDYIAEELWYRRSLFGRGPRSKHIEKDDFRVIGGLLGGKTTGAPISVLILNTEYERYETSLKNKVEDSTTGRKKSLLEPRPGHGDLVGYVKYRYDSLRDALENSSGRETVGRVALGAFAKKLLYELCGTQVISHVTAIGKIRNENQSTPQPRDIKEILKSQLRIFKDKKFEDNCILEIESARKRGTTLGGSGEVLIFDPPRYLGSYVHHELRLDALLGSALLSIPSVKALRIGDDIFENDGFSSHDSPYLNGDKLMYRSNKCGGIEAGISNGEIIKLNFHCKPLPTVFPGNESFNLRSGAASRAITQRSDTCAVASIGVIAEAVSALTLTELLTKRYGEEHIDLIANNIENFNSFNSDKKLRIDEDVYKKKQ